MNIYSFDQIHQDIWSFEGVDFKVQGEDLKRQLFYRLYSEYYKEPLNGDSTVDDMKARLDEYFNSSYLPRLEALPDVSNDSNFYIYVRHADSEVFRFVEVHSLNPEQNEDELKQSLSAILKDAKSLFEIDRTIEEIATYWVFANSFTYARPQNQSSAVSH